MRSATTTQHAEPMCLRDQVLVQRYLRKDQHGCVNDTPDQMFRRTARTVAEVEIHYGATCQEALLWEERFYRIMVSGRFLPNSPTLMNAGREKGLLSACFVLPVEDSIDAIFEAIKQAALIQKAGGGTGFAFDQLRPTGDLVASSGGRTSGPISFMRAFSEATSAIQQGAFRRGANMAMISIEHPDILKFIVCKAKPGTFENFNISVKVTDDFMDRLKDAPDTPHVVVNPRTGLRYLIPKQVNPTSCVLQDLVPADRTDAAGCSIRDIWNLLVTNAHATGEPGVCFIDRVNQANPTPQLGRIEATNPCGEQPLLPYESCTLGSINLAKFVDDQGQDIQWEALRETICLAVHFLDNVIDASGYPIQQVADATKATRKIGLGLMGVADALVKLGICYDSEQAVEFAKKIGAFISDAAHDASEALARVRGSFPSWDGSTWNTLHHRPMRNATCTTIAPTGSISIIAVCSSGNEPIFSLASKRRALDGKEFVEVHPLLEQLGEEGGWINDRVRTGLLDGVPPQRIAGVPPKLAETLVTAHQVAPEWHVRMQAAFQKHTDNAVSKTVNLPADATKEDVDQIFRLAYDLGCKGITVYRDGSREGQTLSNAAADRKEQLKGISRPRPRARVTSGTTTKFRMGCGTLFVSVNRDAEGLAEVFANLGKAGGCPSQSEATCRAISAALRSGVDPAVLIEQLKGIRCLSAASRSKQGVDVLSCPDAIARAMEEAMGQQAQSNEPHDGRSCPDCGQKLRHEAGCLVCGACGYNRCG